MGWNDGPSIVACVDMLAKDLEAINEVGSVVAFRLAWPSNRG